MANLPLNPGWVSALCATYEKQYGIKVDICYPLGHETLLITMIGPDPKKPGELQQVKHMISQLELENAVTPAGMLIEVMNTMVESGGWKPVEKIKEIDKKYGPETVQWGVYGAPEKAKDPFEGYEWKTKVAGPALPLDSTTGEWKGIPRTDPPASWHPQTMDELYAGPPGGWPQEKKQKPKQNSNLFNELYNKVNEINSEMLKKQMYDYLNSNIPLLEELKKKGKK